MEKFMKKRYNGVPHLGTFWESAPSLKFGEESIQALLLVFSFIMFSIIFINQY